MQKSAILIPYSVQIEKNILQTEHCKGLVRRTSARAFKRFQKIVQCERRLRNQDSHQLGTYLGGHILHLQRQKTKTGS